MKVLKQASRLVYMPEAGTRLDLVCIEVAWLAETAGVMVTFRFNETELKCWPGDDAHHLIEWYNTVGPGRDEI